METEIFNLLLSGGPFGAVAAFFFYRWQKAENELKDFRAAQDIKTEAAHKAMLDLQEKRIVDGVRIEGVLQSNTNAMVSHTRLLEAIANQGAR